MDTELDVLTRCEETMPRINHAWEVVKDHYKTP